MQKDSCILADTIFATVFSFFPSVLTVSLALSHYLMCFPLSFTLFLYLTCLNCSPWHLKICKHEYSTNRLAPGLKTDFLSHRSSYSRTGWGSFEFYVITGRGSSGIQLFNASVDWWKTVTCRGTQECTSSLDSETMGIRTNNGEALLRWDKALRLHCIL